MTPSAGLRAGGRVGRLPDRPAASNTSSIAGAASPGGACGMPAMDATDTREIRKSEEQLSSLLNRLDAAASPGAGKRRADRFNYRNMTVVTEFLEPAGHWVKCRTPTRNISVHGVGLLVGKFVYPGTRCRVHLVSVHDQKQVCEGTVVFCRYLTETATVHEVGVRFDVPIDVEMFHPGAARFRILLVDDDPCVHRLVKKLLSRMNVELVSAMDGNEALAQAEEHLFDVILMDMDMPEMDGLTALKKLREAGYMRPVIAATAHTDEKTRKECMQAGFNLVLAKPFTREALQQAIVSQRDDPIVSTLLHEPEMAEVIDAFVADLPDRVRELEGAFAKKDMQRLEAAARRLKGEAGGYGFQVITDAAAKVEQLITEKKDPSELRDALNRLTRLCLAARPVNLQVREQEGEHVEATE